MVYSDESWFVLSTDDNLFQVWRRTGVRYSSPHILVRHTARIMSVMVWGSIDNYSRSTLVVVRGTLTGQGYTDDIARLHVGPFLNGLSGAIFQKDNARSLTARVAQDFLSHVHTLPMAGPLPRLVPYRACVGSAET